MTMTIQHPEALKKRANELASLGLNGIDMVLVDLQPSGTPSEAQLSVHFHNSIALGDIKNDVSSTPELVKEIFKTLLILGKNR